MRKKKIGLFLYNRFLDPLIQSNFWFYIIDYLDNDKEVKFTVISYEDPRFPITEEQKKNVEAWRTRGLEWVQLKWHPGLKYTAKMLDILQGFFTILKLRMKGYRHFVAFTSIAGSYLYLYYLVLRFDYFLYSYEPHSEYAADNKMWKRDSLHYKVANYLERRSAFRAKVIVSGTRFMEQRLKDEWRVKGIYIKIPVVANDQKFLFSEENRRATRQRLGFTSSTRVLFYPGKFGDLYYRGEAALMFKWLKECDPAFHFLIVTPHSDAEVEQLFEGAGVSRSDYTIAHSDYEGIHHYFAAADFGVISVPPGPSKKFISNIKVGEYLTAGLPYLITEGISEDYLFALERKVGVVVKDFKEEYIKGAYPEIDEYLKMNRDELRSRCREAGLEYRGFKGLNAKFKEAINYLCA